LNAMKLRRALTAAIVSAILASPCSTYANQIPGELITGHVTAVGGGSFQLDGRQYRIKVGSAAEAALRKLAPGQLVDVQLDGPANTSASEVINIVPHPSR
jgi:hypothetical protein